MRRTTRSIGAATAAAVAPEEALDVEQAALDVLADLGDDAFVEVQIRASRKTRAVFPVGFLRRYLAAQSVPGRQVLVFDSDKEVSSEVAASDMGTHKRPASPPVPQERSASNPRLPRARPERRAAQGALIRRPRRAAGR